MNKDLLFKTRIMQLLKTTFHKTIRKILTLKVLSAFNALPHAIKNTELYITQKTFFFKN